MRSKKNVLVTGACGFLGRNFVKYLSTKDFNIIAVGRSVNVEIFEGLKKVRYIACDVFSHSEFNSVLSENRIDICVHFAWEGTSGVKRSDYNLQMKNAIKTVDLMKNLSLNGCNNLLVAGSIMEKEIIEIMGSQKNFGSPNYIYGMGKYMCHCLCKEVAEEIKMNLYWGVITNVYGEGELSARFINTTLRKINSNEELKFTTASQNYDFIHIDDAVRAFYTIMMNGENGKEYIIGSGNPKPLKEYISNLIKTIDYKGKVSYGDVKFEGCDLPLSSFKINSIQKELNFKTNVSFEDGICRTYQWIKSERYE